MFGLTFCFERHTHTSSFSLQIIPTVRPSEAIADFHWKKTWILFRVPPSTRKVASRGGGKGGCWNFSPIAGLSATRTLGCLSPRFSRSCGLPSPPPRGPHTGRRSPRLRRSPKAEKWGIPRSFGTSNKNSRILLPAQGEVINYTRSNLPEACSR